MGFHTHEIAFDLESHGQIQSSAQSTCQMINPVRCPQNTDLQNLADVVFVLPC